MKFWRMHLKKIIMILNLIFSLMNKMMSNNQKKINKHKDWIMNQINNRNNNKISSNSHIIKVIKAFFFFC